MTMNRRSALKTMGGLAGMAALPKFLSACGDDGDGGPAGITTYVFLMLENRSYDHVMGARSWKEGKPGDGLSDGITNPDANGNPVALYEPQSTAEAMCISNDPPHGWTTSRQQWQHPDVTGPNQGFVKVHQQAGHPGAIEPMQYLTRKQQPITWALADAYTSCDRWFSSILGPTLPNRAYFLAGTSAGFRSNDPIYNPTRDDGSSRPPLDVDTIFHRLRDKDIDWRSYYGNLPVISAANSRLAPARQFDTEYLQAHVKPFGDSEYSEGRFFIDAAAGTLPPVVYIEPAFYVNDDHPPSHPILAQALIASVYTALANSPQWKNVMLVITYDEHGGFYDHVEPPTLPPEHDDTKDRFPYDDDGTPNTTPGQFDQLGFRVPTIVIGPYVKQGHVSSVQYDHTSTLKQLQQAFELDPLSARSAHANDLTDCIDMDRLARGDWAPPVQLPQFDFTRDSRGEIMAVTVAGETWPYAKGLCAPGLTSFRGVDAINDLANRHPEVFEGFDLRASEDRYLRSIDEFLARNQGKVGR
jgi:phospholipase C